MSQLGPILNLKLCDSLLVTSPGGHRWRVSVYLGMEYYVSYPHLNRLFIAQNRYLSSMQQNLKPEVRVIKTPIPKSFEAEYKDALDLILEKHPELCDSDNSESSKEKWERVLGKNERLRQQTITGRTVQIMKTGCIYSYGQRRLSSAKHLPIVLKKLEEFEKYIATHPFLRAMVPEPTEFVDGFPKFHYRTMTDSDFAGESGGISVGAEFHSVNGIFLGIKSVKQGVGFHAVGEAELNAACTGSRTQDGNLEFNSELGLTYDELISESQYLDNNSGIEISYGKSLSKRSKCYRTRELGLRQKVQNPLRVYPFEIGRIESALNPANGGTKALTGQQWIEFADHCDTTFIELDDFENMEGVVKKYGDWMAEYVPAEKRYRSGKYT